MPRRRRWVAALLTTLSAAPVLAGLTGTPAAAAPTAAVADVASDSVRTTVTLTELTPASPGPDDTITLRGTITNNGDAAITDGTVDAREAVALSSRSAMDDAVERQGFTDSSVEGEIVRGHGQDIGTIPPGLSTTFELQVPVDALSLGEDGVYQIGVTLTGQTEAERWDHIYGVGRTLLPWYQESSSTPDTRLTVLWPLISTTHLTAETGPDSEQTPAFRDDSLLQEISPGGRLDQLVSLGTSLPVTWVIDPDLLASVEAMTEGYRIDTPEGAVDGQGQDEATAFLQRLREAVSGDEVIALPFADPDIASLAHQGQEVRGALGHLRDATEMAGDTVEAVLDTDSITNVTWPVEGAVDPSIVTVGTSAGADTIIARSDSLRTPDSLDYTPSAVRALDEGISATVADARLSTLFEGDMTSAGNVSQARQELLAQTLAVAQQDAPGERNILLAPQRMPDLAQAQAMAEAISALQREGSWIGFADFSETAAATPDPAFSQEVPSAEAYPQELRDRELPTSAFQAMRQTERTLEDFTVILTQADRVETPYGNALRREMSTSWRGNAQEASVYRASVQNGLDDLRSQVHLIQKTPITLSGRSATIPVTVQNNLVQDVEGLTLRITSSRRFGLEVSEPQEISVSGGHSQSVKFSTTARASGRVTITAQLYTADNKPYGQPMEFTADVTSITSAVMMVIAGGLLLVVLAGIRMYTQRKRAARISGSDEGAPDADAEARPEPGAAPSGQEASEGTPPGEAASGDTGGTGRPPGEHDADTGGGNTGTQPGSERLDDDQ
ncbi:DUF6049 family protein [Streptomyces sp. RFCAC02]|uniref:DUF6049 family protein n=1 Tax=Streptomyces sp. RFCAC02 TaxID=2499143 RepID=UPI001021AB7B|nr:DUF6049 family protein [Streptomyces sp. RFCAC02]